MAPIHIYKSWNQNARDGISQEVTASNYADLLFGGAVHVVELIEPVLNMIRVSINVHNWSEGFGKDLVRAYQFFAEVLLVTNCPGGIFAKETFILGSHLIKVHVVHEEAHRVER